MRKPTIAIALVIGLTTAAAFTAGNTFAQTTNDGNVAPQNIAQTTMPANDTAKMPMNGHMGTMPMFGQDMSKMPMNNRMAMMGNMMNSCGTMMLQQGMNSNVK